MKKFYINVLLLFTLGMAEAQFSIDPSQPMNFCNLTGGKENLQALPDGNNGYFVFWRDHRNGSSYHLYGQHFNSDGVPQWTANGKSIVAPVVKTVSGYKCIPFSGGILVTWLQSATSGYSDSLMCKKINYSGNDVWAQPTLIAISGVNSIIYLENYNINAMPNDSGAFIGYSAVYIGGSSVIQYNRIDFNGVLKWPNALYTTLPGYVFLTYAGTNNTFYSLSRGNGLGSGIYIQKFDLSCNPQWANPVDVSLGVNTNGFGGLHYIFPDISGNIYIVWETNSYKVRYAKLTAAGTFSWATSTKQVSALTSTEVRPNAFYRSNKLYVAWNDNRITGQTTVFAQKIDSAGTAQWTTDGVQIGSCNGSYDYPKITYSDSNSVFCAYHNGTPWNLYAQRIRSNGSLTWSGNGKVLSSANVFIQYDYMVTVGDTAGCNPVFWEHSNDYLFGAKICSDGNLVNVASEENAKTGFTIYPNPARDIFNISWNEFQQLSSVEILDIQGKQARKLPIEKGSNLISVKATEFDKGIYFVKLQMENGFAVKKLVIQ